MPTTNGARAPRRLTSTPQSVEPATRTASGCSSSSRRRWARSTARSNTPLVPMRRVGAGAGAGRSSRSARTSCGSRAVEGEGGVTDRAVAGAAAQVAADGVEVEPVRPVLVVGVGAAPAVRPVVLRRHRADEAGRAVPALGAAAHRELALDGVEGAGRSQSLGGDDLLAVEGGGRHEAGVDRRPAAPVRAVGAHDEHRARAALALGAALLGTGQPLAAHEVEGGGRRVRADERAPHPVDGHRRRSGWHRHSSVPVAGSVEVHRPRWGGAPRQGSGSAVHPRRTTPRRRRGRAPQRLGGHPAPGPPQVAPARAAAGTLDDPTARTAYARPR